jgi:hypothetical protein
MEDIMKGLGAIIVAVIGGIAVWWLTTTPGILTPVPAATSRPATVVPTTPPRSFMERLVGNYELISWNQASGPIDLGVGIKDGTLEIDSSGNVDWDLDIWDKAANPSTPANTTARQQCGGRVSSESQQIIWVFGGDRNRSSGGVNDMRLSDDTIFLALCGGDVTGVRSASFSLTLDEQSNGSVFLEMSNSEGTYRWRKDT